jgi:large subunit ribosomal protein L9
MESIMEVILRENVPGLGNAGSKVKAKDGYARNYLFPRNLAVAVTPQNMKALEQEQKIKAQKLERNKKEAEQVKTKIGQLSITISVLTQEDEKLYGSITSLEIHKALQDEGIEIDKNAIALDEPIKSLGVFEIPVKLHPEVIATLKVWIVKK